MLKYVLTIGTEQRNFSCSDWIKRQTYFNVWLYKASASVSEFVLYWDVT